LSELQFDPFSYATQEDPFPSYERLREQAPVWRSPEHGFYAIARHADVLAALRDPARFSNRQGIVIESGFEQNAIAIFSILAMDPPRHDQARALISRGFTPRRVGELEPYIRALAVTRLAALRDARRIDFITDYAAEIPLQVICEMLGVPEADRNSLREFADAMIYRDEGSSDIPPSAVQASLDLRGYFSDWVADAKRRSREDLAGTILRAEIEGERLSEDEVIGFLFLLVLAGSETTRNLLGNAVYWLWRYPEQRAAVIGDPSRVPEWVEETLRFDSPTQAVARVIERDTRVGAVDLPAGARALLLLGSANRDPRVFDAADEFRIGRDTSAMLAMGQGTHFCLGASLARLEARVCLEEWLRFAPAYELDAEAAQRLRSTSVHGFSTLPVSVGRDS